MANISYDSLLESNNFCCCYDIVIVMISFCVNFLTRPRSSELNCNN